MLPGVGERFIPQWDVLSRRSELCGQDEEDIQDLKANGRHGEEINNSVHVLLSSRTQRKFGILSSKPEDSASQDVNAIRTPSYLTA
jgi:hypothetical protein